MLAAANDDVNFARDVEFGFKGVNLACPILRRPFPQAAIAPVDLPRRRELNVV
jgi:hypothetical protein